MLIFSTMVIHLGTAAFAAQQVVFSAASLSMMPGQAFAVAATTLVGQYLGAGDRRGAARAGWHSTAAAAGWMTLAGLGFVLYPEPFLRLYTTDPAVIQAGIAGIRVVGLGQPFQAVAFVLAGALRGAGDTRTTLLVGGASMWGVRLTCSYVFGLVLGWGIPGHLDRLDRGLVRARGRLPGRLRPRAVAAHRGRLSAGSTPGRSEGAQPSRRPRVEDSRSGRTAATPPILHRREPRAGSDGRIRLRLRLGATGHRRPLGSPRRLTAAVARPSRPAGRRFLPAGAVSPPWLLVLRGAPPGRVPAADRARAGHDGEERGSDAVPQAGGNGPADLGDRVRLLGDRRRLRRLRCGRGRSRRRRRPRSGGDPLRHRPGVRRRALGAAAGPGPRGAPVGGDRRHQVWSPHPPRSEGAPGQPLPVRSSTTPSRACATWGWTTSTSCCSTGRTRRRRSRSRCAPWWRCRRRARRATSGSPTSTPRCCTRRSATPPSSPTR